MGHKGQFQPGVSGNPKGRPPKGLTIADLFAQEGDQPIALTNKENTTVQTMTRRAALIKVIYERAIGGDDAFARLCLEREFGKALEQIQITEGRATPLDMSKYTEKELVTLMALLKKGEPDADTPEAE
jgi:hypothetical protein